MPRDKAVRAYFYHVPSLARIRIARQLTQLQLATRADMTRQNVTALERVDKPQRARMSTIEKLATALDTTVDNLMQEPPKEKKTKKQEVTV